MKPESYIGVSGFMSADEVRAALAHHTSSRRLMVGILASSKTLCGHPNRYPRRYPKPDQAGAIFVDDPRCLNLVHVAPGEVPSHEQVSDGDGGWATVKMGTGRIPFAVDLWRAMLLGGPLCHGVQVNKCWPGPSDVLDIRLFRDRYPCARVVLQIGPRAMSMGVPSHSGGLCLYQGAITDVLIDASAGRGVGLDPALAASWIQRVRERLPDVGIGIAGGLSAETLRDHEPLLRMSPGLSIDAEGQLRDDADGGGNLDLDKVAAYLRVAGDMLS